MLNQKRVVIVKSIQNSRKLLRALDNLSNVTKDLEEHFTDELSLFFGYLYRKIIKNVDLEQPLNAIFYQQVSKVIDEYWKEYYDILSSYVDKSAVIGDVYYEILLNASKDRAKTFQATKSRNKDRTFLDNELHSSETDELFAPNPEVSSKLENYKFEASEKTKKRVNNEINEILATGYREGWGPRDVAKKIEQKFTNLKGYEARRIAQTEINTTRNFVQYNRLVEDDMEYKIWHSAHDSRTRKSHLAVDEEIVPINERFSNGLMYPGDKDGPIEEWVNCRCSHAAFIMPLGYTAPDFWPFTESDLVKVGSSISQDYVQDIRERLRVMDGVLIEEQRTERIEKPPVVTPQVTSKPKQKPKPKPTKKPKAEPTVDVNRMSSNELYESMTKADKKKYDKAKQSIENIKKTIPVTDPLFKKMTEKHYKVIRDLEAKQKQKLMNKAKGNKPKKDSKKLTKAQEKELQTFKEETPLSEKAFDKVEKWADKRCKGKIEYGYKFDVNTGELIGEEIRGSKGQVNMMDEGKDVGSLHIHTEDGMSFPSDTDIISYRCQKEQEHYIVSDKEIWHVHAEENFGMMGRLTQADVSQAYAKCIKEGNAAVEQKMREGKIGLDEKSIKEACDKEIGDRILKEFDKPEWKDKGLTIRRAYR